MKHLFPTLLVVAAAASQLGSTDCGQVLRDPGFDLWCGDQLCAWQVERGSVQRVPTWNEGDPGVELVGPDTAIEQLAPVDSYDGSCIEFDMIADVDLDAQVFLNVDVFGDGSVERIEQLPTAHWKPLSYKLPIKGVYKGIRFELAKQGPGHAVLAQIQAKIATDCQDEWFPIEPKPAPLGAPCTDNAGCASGLCEGVFLGPGVCVGCDDATATCPSGSVCGLAAPTSPVRDVPVACVDAGAKPLGDQCRSDGECASGICTFGTGAPTTLYPGGAYGSCSTCRPSSDGVSPPTGCTAGEACGPAWLPDGAVNPYGFGPWVCSPNAHARQHGEPCASDADCASGSCAGAVRTQCDDGRACATAADCPFGTPDTDTGLQNGPCDTVGIQGGTCQ